VLATVVLTLFALVTEAGKLFHILTILIENETFLTHYDISSWPASDCARQNTVSVLLKKCQWI